MISDASESTPADEDNRVSHRVEIIAAHSSGHSLCSRHDAQHFGSLHDTQLNDSTDTVSSHRGEKFEEW